MPHKTRRQAFDEECDNFCDEFEDFDDVELPVSVFSGFDDEEESLMKLRNIAAIVSLFCVGAMPFVFQSVRHFLAAIAALCVITLWVKR